VKTLRRSRRRGSTHIEGVARIGRRTKDLVKRLLPGEIAVIDHADIDRVAADALVDAGIVAVVNASSSMTGRYPNGGPLRIVRAGLTLIDQAGPELLDRLTDGQRIELADNRVLCDGEELASGRVLDEIEILDRMDQSRAGIGGELQRFAENTLEYVRKEAVLTFSPLALPDLRTRFEGRHAVIVVRGHDYREDLRHLRAYIREYRPVTIGVDGGADALIELGVKPDIILGDFDSVSARAMEVGAELIHHVHPDGRAPGRAELAHFAKPYVEFVVEGTSEDAAMLLAYEAGAKLIVAVGTHATMVEFLDKGRDGMSSTFLTRLRLGPMLVDAKGVSRLYEGKARRRDLILLVLSAVMVMVVVGVIAEPIHVYWQGLWLTLRNFWFSITGKF